jgi:hypothetical protein
MKVGGLKMSKIVKNKKKIEIVMDIFDKLFFKPKKR